MKVGLISDVHGNHLALRAVLKAAKKKGVNKLLITGDLVGYYFWVKEVLELLSNWDFEIVKGNHEEMLAYSLVNKDYLNEVDKKYGKGLRHSINTLDLSQIDWLVSLPHPLEINFEHLKLLLCHGSPWDLNEYIYPDTKDSMLESLKDSKYDWIVLGHTHYPMIRKFKNTMLINPGSVGQPRNGVQGAHWAILDTEAGSVQNFVESYDITWIIKQVRKLEPNHPYLAQVLERK
ncbi:metallophosphoesterase family protein [Leptospira noguchii]|uniref:metallophosphoesterase family protein n=1 Tax=Leptospira noguchii TaxID=28182 RepID=UPI000773D8AB|nr:metallophosphoesterase family protein [Leptospira noguchii]UOG59332.1 metallophosphatase family protein [Leptospira noguchii]